MLSEPHPCSAPIRPYPAAVKHAVSKSNPAFGPRQSLDIWQRLSGPKILEADDLLPSVVPIVPDYVTDCL